jgi:hypothetical protein
LLNSAPLFRGKIAGREDFSDRVAPFSPKLQQLNGVSVFDIIPSVITRPVFQSLLHCLKTRRSVMQTCYFVHISQIGTYLKNRHFRF